MRSAWCINNYDVLVTSLSVCLSVCSAQVVNKRVHMRVSKTCGSNYVKPHRAPSRPPTTPPGRFTPADDLCRQCWAEYSVTCSVVRIMTFVRLYAAGRRMAPPTASGDSESSHKSRFSSCAVLVSVVYWYGIGIDICTTWLSLLFTRIQLLLRWPRNITR